MATRPHTYIVCRAHRPGGVHYAGGTADHLGCRGRAATQSSSGAAPAITITRIGMEVQQRRREISRRKEEKQFEHIGSTEPRSSSETPVFLLQTYSKHTYAAQNSAAFLGYLARHFRHQPGGRFWSLSSSSAHQTSLPGTLHSESQRNGPLFLVSHVHILTCPCLQHCAFC